MRRRFVWCRFLRFLRVLPLILPLSTWREEKRFMPPLCLNVEGVAEGISVVVNPTMRKQGAADTCLIKRRPAAAGERKPVHKTHPYVCEVAFKLMVCMTKGFKPGFLK